MVRIDLTPELLAQFHQNHQLDLVTNCGRWTGPITDDGQPCIPVVDQRKPLNVLATHIAYALKYGPVPDNLRVGHTCGDPMCVTPDHVFSAGYQKEVGATQSQRHAGVGGRGVLAHDSGFSHDAPTVS